MSGYLLRRLLTTVPILLAMSFILFGVISLAPGDPLAQFGSNPAVPPEVRETIRQSLGLDQPWYLRYFYWLREAVSGNLGYSFASRLPVSELLKQRIPTTLEVIGVAYLVSVAVALPLGIVAGVRRFSLLDSCISLLTFLGFCTPSFFVGLTLIIVFSLRLGWLPAIYNSTVDVTTVDGVVQQIKQSIMPIGVLALYQTATLTRYVRAAVADNAALDYVRTARAKGLGDQQVVLRHVVRNSLIPVVTLVALGMPAVFTGAVITEQIFRVPGLGELLIRSIQSGDTPVVMAITFVYGALVVAFNLVADMLYGVIDPRIRRD